MYLKPKHRHSEDEFLRFKCNDNESLLIELNDPYKRPNNNELNRTCH